MKFIISSSIGIPPSLYPGITLPFIASPLPIVSKNELKRLGLEENKSEPTGSTLVTSGTDCGLLITIARGITETEGA